MLLTVTPSINWLTCINLCYTSYYDCKIKFVTIIGLLAVVRRGKVNRRSLATCFRMCSVFLSLFQIHLYGYNGECLHKLMDENLASVCSICVFHPTQQIIFGGNSSGRVHVFM